MIQHIVSASKTPNIQYPMGSRKLLSLGDAAISTADLSLLVPPSWLNDSLISFWVEHLRLHVIHTPKVLILPPNISYFLALCDDQADAQQLVHQLKLRERELILVTVNDASVRDFTQVEGPTGSHWSLLVFQRCHAPAFFYLDSMRARANRRVAQLHANKLARLLGESETPFAEVDVPLQQNMYDCGAYLCVFAQHVIQNFEMGNSVAQLYKHIRPPTGDDVENMRQEIGKLACRLLDEKQRTAAPQHPP